MNSIDPQPGEIFVVALPGTHVRVQWIHENGAIECERVYHRPEEYPPIETGDLAQLNRSANNVGGEIRYFDGSTYYNSMHELTTANILKIRERVEDVKTEVVRLQQENADLRARLKPDAAYF